MPAMVGGFGNIPNIIISIIPIKFLKFIISIMFKISSLFLFNVPPYSKDRANPESLEDTVKTPAGLEDRSI